MTQTPCPLCDTGHAATAGCAPEHDLCDACRWIPGPVVREIQSLAEKDAALFVEEHGEALDPALTDWDGVAWESCTLSEAAQEAQDLDPHGDGSDPLWPVYQHLLVRETRRLAGG